MGHSCFGRIIIKVLMTIPVSTTLPLKMWTKNVSETGSLFHIIFTPFSIGVRGHSCFGHCFYLASEIKTIGLKQIRNKTFSISHFKAFHRGKRKIDVTNPSLNNIALIRVNYSNFWVILLMMG